MYTREEIIQIILFLGSCLLSVNLMSLYRHTFISPYIIPILYVITGIAGIYLYFNKMSLQHKNKIKDTLIKLTFCFVVGGGITTSVFMGLNYYIPITKPVIKIFPIVERGGYMNDSRTGPNHLYAAIRYNDQLKEIPFDSKSLNGMSNYRFIEFELSRGLFGFEVIKNERPL